MKLNKAGTQLGITFNVIEFEDSDILGFIQDPTKVTRVTDCVNADRRQKVALVEGRSDLSEKIDTLGFTRKTKQVTKDGETVTVPAETEGEHIDRFTASLADGSFTTPGFNKPSGDAKTAQKAAEAFLQSIADTCGDKVDAEGKPCYVLDITKAIRKPGTGLVPKWAMAGATQIITNGSQQKWAEKFTTGYTSGSGVAIDPIAFENFQVVPAHHLPPDEKQAVLHRNTINLAKALIEQRRQEDAKRAPEFA
jgi:hypothetical protein